MRPLVFAATALCLACQPVPPPRPPVVEAIDASVPPPPDAAFVGPTTPAANCAYAMLEWLGCSEGMATPRDRDAGIDNQESCRRVYARATNFPGLTLPAACACQARSVDAVRACGIKCGAK
jgi:hypothetical protein